MCERTGNGFKFLTVFCVYPAWWFGVTQSPKRDGKCWQQDAERANGCLLDSGAEIDAGVGSKHESIEEAHCLTDSLNKPR